MPKTKKRPKIKLIYLATIILAICAIGILVYDYVSKDYPLQDATAYSPDKLKPAEDHVVVKFKSKVKDKDKDNIARSENVQKEDLAEKTKAVKLDVPQGTSAEDFVEELRTEYSGQVDYVELDYKAGVNMVPNDPLYSYQWQLPKVSAPQAWDVSQGSDQVIVAVLDTGASSHPDVSDKYIAGYNFVDNNDDPEDGHGHGTFVSGVIAAMTNNNTGVAGSGPNLKIMPVKVLSDEGWGYYTWIASGITWAVDNGADVINMSLGGSASSSVLQEAINYAHSKGVIVFASSGNNGTSNPSYPAACNYTVSVGATDSTDTRASFSQYGLTLDIVAPGVNVFSTKKGGSYGYWSGTSFSSPIAAALGALVISENPSFSPNQVEGIIKANADDLGAAGRDNYYGWGRVNFYRTLTGEEPPVESRGSIAGRVMQVGLNSPVSGATITVYQDNTKLTSGQSLSSGYYLISDLPAGYYKVRVTASGFGSKTRYVTVADGRITSKTDFWVYSMMPVVVGKVIDVRTKRPIRNATVRLYTVQRKTLAVVRTNYFGEYVIQNIMRTGYHRIYANHLRYRILRRWVPVDFYTAIRRNFALRR